MARSLLSHGSTLSSACSSATPALNASSPRRPGGDLQRLATVVAEVLERTDQEVLVRQRRADLHRGVPGGEHREVVLVQIGDGLRVVRGELALRNLVHPGADELAEQLPAGLAADRLRDHADGVLRLNEAEGHCAANGTRCVGRHNCVRGRPIRVVVLERARRRAGPAAPSALDSSHAAPVRRMPRRSPRRSVVHGLRPRRRRRAGGGQGVRGDARTARDARGPTGSTAAPARAGGWPSGISPSSGGAASCATSRPACCTGCRSRKTKLVAPVPDGVVSRARGGRRGRRRRRRLARDRRAQLGPRARRAVGLAARRGLLRRAGGVAGARVGAGARGRRAVAVDRERRRVRRRSPLPARRARARAGCARRRRPGPPGGDRARARASRSASRRMPTSIRRSTSRTPARAPATPAPCCTRGSRACGSACAAPAARRPSSRPSPAAPTSSAGASWTGTACRCSRTRTREPKGARPL